MSGVDVHGDEPKGPSQVEQIVLQEGHVAMQRAMMRVEAEWKRRSVRARRTGTYGRSITWIARRQGKTVFGRVGVNVAYGRYLEYGTGVYGPRHRMIVPLRASVLRFPEPRNPGFTLAGRQRSGRAGMGARWVYTRRVRGIRPRRYARDAAMVAQPYVIREFEAAGRRAAERIVG
jgi:hypothetical protein